MKKTLVAYFSASGVTAEAAKAVAEKLGAELYEIRPAVPYTEADLDWRDPESRSSVEMRDPAFRPELAAKDAELAAYDTIYLGFPIWWHVAPTVINTFLEAYDFAGKTIVLFGTAGSEGFGKTVEAMKDSCPGAVIREGCVRNRNNGAEYAAWLESLS
ncbi:MAG: flavodoxin [Ruminococcaceae bacterium]|nr:flavodoxin [Oscillospiraceae bacterium]